MKKIFALLLVAVMSLTLLAGCGDPINDDLTNFVNVSMADVNADYKKLTEEVSTWNDLPDDAAIVNSINTVLLPLVDKSLASLETINPETEEVKNIKGLYVKVMEAYKDGFTVVAEGCTAQDVEIVTAGYEKLGEAVEILNEYNAALEELAAAHGAEVEY